jgi:cAMP phosphodiesterase
MKLRVLGCSGGIGGNLHTTSFLLDHDVLIDAGTGVTQLSFSELAMIDHVFVTHSHLDHVACIPFMVDSVGFVRDKPLTVYACQDTLDILREHIFNWDTWPDFSKIPSKGRPYMRYQPFEVGETLDLGGRKISPLPANHVVPAVGFQLDSGKASLVFSGDTTSNDAFWHAVNKIQNLRYLLIETAFPNRERDLAIVSKHLCPSMLADELGKFRSDAEVYITHLKPGEVELTMTEIEACVPGPAPRMLLNNHEFEF